MSKFLVGDIAEDNDGYGSYIKGRVVKVDAHRVWLHNDDCWIHESNLKLALVFAFRKWTKAAQIMFVTEMLK